MINFNGPKYQQGKIGADHEPTQPEAVELAKRLARKSKVSNVVVDGEERLYIYINLGKRNSYGNHYKQKLATAAVKAFKTETGIEPIVGFHDLEFTAISKKQAFKLKLDGTGT